MATRPLATVGSARRETGVAFATDLLVTVIFCSEHFEGGLDDAAAEPGFPDVMREKKKKKLQRAHRRTRWSVDSFWML